MWGSACENMGHLSFTEFTYHILMIHPSSDGYFTGSTALLYDDSSNDYVFMSRLNTYVFGRLLSFLGMWYN